MSQISLVELSFIYTVYFSDFPKRAAGARQPLAQRGRQACSLNKEWEAAARGSRAPTSVPPRAASTAALGQTPEREQLQFSSLDLTTEVCVGDQRRGSQKSLQDI